MSVTIIEAPQYRSSRGSQSRDEELFPFTPQHGEQVLLQADHRHPQLLVPARQPAQRPQNKREKTIRKF